MVRGTHSADPCGRLEKSSTCSALTFERPRASGRRGTSRIGSRVRRATVRSSSCCAASAIDWRRRATRIDSGPEARRGGLGWSTRLAVPGGVIRRARTPMSLACRSYRWPRVYGLRSNGRPHPRRQSSCPPHGWVRWGGACVGAVLPKVAGVASIRRGRTSALRRCAAHRDDPLERMGRCPRHRQRPVAGGPRYCRVVETIR